MNQSFAEVVQPYSAVFFDAYGVLKQSTGVLEGVHDALAWLVRSGKDVYVITNDASKSPAAMADALAHPTHGKLIPESKFISSGLLAKDFLRNKVRAGKVAYLGKPAAAFYIEAAGLEAIPVSKCRVEDDPKALVLLDDEGFDWFSDLNRSINLLRRVNIPAIVANADTAYPVDGVNIGVAVGSLATLIENIVGKTFIRFGKPDTMMYSHAFACAHANNPQLTKSDCLMVGDTLHTDILGANT
ncbi:MAG: hypothetical protein RJA70_3849, partial [Pseudomonadota bacterium]